MKVFLIGFGHMGQAIAQALHGAQTAQYEISATSRDANLEKIASSLSVTPDTSYASLKDADVVVVAVKPQDLAALAEEVKGAISENSILVSVAAGVTIAKIQKIFGHGKIVRVMPNLGLSVGQGIAAWKSAGLSADDETNARKFLNDLCENFEVGEEKMIDAVAAISGCGPAYFFAFAASLEKSATDLGLDSKSARALVEKTFAAAALLQKGQDYTELVRKVASTGGMTEAALRVFEKHNLSGIVKEATQTAVNRAHELNEK